MSEPHPDAHCPRCRETVTPVVDLMTSRYVCPWCDGPVEDVIGHEKFYCPKCDHMVDRANDGTCWRCGTRAQRGVPWDPCACGCGTLIHRFDEHGRRIRYVRGHASRNLERGGEVPLEPFAAYLEQRLADLDLIAALAREHGLKRRDVVAILRRDEQSIPRELVRRALWIFGQNGKGMPRRPDAAGFFDLYPDDRRARVCPGCGKGKAPHAELCKACRRRVGSPRSHMPRRIGEPILTAAYRAYRDENLTYKQTAERFLEHTPHTSVDSLANALRDAFTERGWPTRHRTRRSAA